MDEASIENAIHCWTTLLYLGFENETIAKRMLTLTPIAMRMEMKEGINNCSLINDIYNSDIDSLAIALDFLQQHQFFELGRDTVHLFQQGSLPALDAATGRILMSSRSELALSPDGHGGLVAAMANAGLLDLLAQQHIRHLFYHQVDNPTAILCDPALIGFHAQQRSQLTTNVVRNCCCSSW